MNLNPEAQSSLLRGSVFNKPITKPLTNLGGFSYAGRSPVTPVPTYQKAL